METVIKIDELTPIVAQVGIGTITYDKACELITEHVHKRIDESIEVHSIRNKLTPIVMLISLFERGEYEMARKAIVKAKNNINYLSQREVYTR